MPQFPTVDDELAKLPVVSWRAISFPIARIRTTFQQRVVAHERPDRDGAKLEGTGRRAVRVALDALFYNGIVFDRSARTASPLFPDVHREFLLACADRTTDSFVHPVLGTIQCKCESFDSDIEAGRRDGARVQATFVEHTEDSSSLGEPSPLATASIAAETLDTEIPKFPGAVAPVNTSFAKLLFSIQSAAGAVSLFEKRGLALIPGILHQIDLTEQSLQSLALASAHLAREMCVLLRSSLLAVQERAFVKQVVLQYVAPIDTTIGALSAVLGVSATSLATLNPTLMGSPRVPRGTLVRYEQNLA